MLSAKPQYPLMGKGEICPALADRQPKPRCIAQELAEILFQGVTRGVKCSILVCQSSITGDFRGKFNDLLNEIFG